LAMARPMPELAPVRNIFFMLLPFVPICELRLSYLKPSLQPDSEVTFSAPHNVSGPATSLHELFAGRHRRAIRPRKTEWHWCLCARFGRQVAGPGSLRSFFLLGASTRPSAALACSEYLGIDNSGGTDFAVAIGLAPVLCIFHGRRCLPEST